MSAIKIHALIRHLALQGPNGNVPYCEPEPEPHERSVHVVIPTPLLLLLFISISIAAASSRSLHPFQTHPPRHLHLQRRRERPAPPSIPTSPSCPSSSAPPRTICPSTHPNLSLRLTFISNAAASNAPRNVTSTLQRGAFHYNTKPRSPLSSCPARSSRFFQVIRVEVN